MRREHSWFRQTLEAVLTKLTAAEDELLAERIQATLDEDEGEEINPLLWLALTEAEATLIQEIVSLEGLE
jgi:hypothetical protein